MEQEVTMSWWVNNLEHQLGSIHHESQDRAAEATGTQAAELLVAERATIAEHGLMVVVERVTAAERGITVVKDHLTETEAVL